MSAFLLVSAKDPATVEFLRDSLLAVEVGARDGFPVFRVPEDRFYLRWKPAVDEPACGLR